MKSLMRLQPQMDLIPKRNRLNGFVWEFKRKPTCQHDQNPREQDEGISLSPIDFESKRKAKVNGMCTI